MIKIETALARLWREDDGQDLVEYSLLVVLVALGTIAAADRMGDAAARALREAARTLVGL
jgi:Flp pilus assembly pilin Flp